VTTLYDLLGADPSASQEVLKAAYRRRARELHPDVNRSREAGGEMRRLNQAWAVLSDPDARRRYDEQLAAETLAAQSAAQAAAQSAAAQRPPPTSDEPGTRQRAATFEADILPERFPWWAWMFRPSVLLLVVLFLIFIGTAYATHPGSGGSLTPRPTSSTPSTTAGQPAGSTATTAAVGPNLVGRCIVNQATSVLVVPCSETPNSLVVAVVPNEVPCPAGTTGLLLEGQPERVCAQMSGP